jgi:hypothetical protein
MAYNIGPVIHFRGSSAELHRLLSLVPSSASGSGTTLSAAQILQVRVGLAALSRIKQAFVLKSQGGTDESGDRWAPLSKKTIAYSRRHPKLFLKGGARSTAKRTGYLPKGSVRAADRPSWMLMKRQNERWWAVYRRFLGVFKGDKSHAAAAAWVVLKREGATTLLATYGTLPALILRDTGLLINSLSPGVRVGDPPPPVPPPIPEDQVFRYPKGEIILGTSRKWAGTHHRGVPGHIPQRRLWPDPARWPANWWDDILTQARLGLVDVILQLLGATP